MRALLLALTATLTLTLTSTLAACSSNDLSDEQVAPPSGPESGSQTRPESGPGTTSAAPTPRADPLPAVRHPISLPAIMREPLRAGPLRRGAVIEANDAYVRTEVTYRSDGLVISGVLLRPRGRGPFPGVVLNHGYIDPASYVTGQGLAREQDWLARAGFVVLHTDYRGHAGSDEATIIERESRLGYARDAANAVRALAREPFVDGRRMAMLGRSMGGGITQDVLVAYPDLVEAGVIYASVSSNYVENLRHFTVPGRPEVARRLVERFGTPRESPSFYRGLSPRTYFDRIDVAVLSHHGTADETCPFGWAAETHRLMRRAGVDSRLAAYEGELHAFVPRWQDSIERTVAFLRRQLR